MCIGVALLPIARVIYQQQLREKRMSNPKTLGNGLGQNKVPAFDPSKQYPHGAVGDTGQKNVAPAKRPGAGAKQ